jgi:hypothetical protein
LGSTHAKRNNNEEDTETALAYKSPIYDAHLTHIVTYSEENNKKGYMIISCCKIKIRVYNLCAT